MHTCEELDRRLRCVLGALRVLGRSTNSRERKCHCSSAFPGVPSFQKRGRPFGAYTRLHNKHTKKCRVFAGHAALQLDDDTVAEGDATRSAIIDLALRIEVPIQLFEDMTQERLGATSKTLIEQAVAVENDRAAALAGLKQKARDSVIVVVAEVLNVFHQTLKLAEDE